MLFVESYSGWVHLRRLFLSVWIHVALCFAMEREALYKKKVPLSNLPDLPCSFLRWEADMPPERGEKRLTSVHLLQFPHPVCSKSKRKKDILVRRRCGELMSLQCCRIVLSRNYISSEKSWLLQPLLKRFTSKCEVISAICQNERQPGGKTPLYNIMSFFVAE